MSYMSYLSLIHRFCMNLSDHRKDGSQYRCASRIDVDQPIYTVALSPCGRNIAFGGEKQPLVRATETGELRETPQYFRQVDGAVTTMHWLNLKLLMFGTSYGYVHIWDNLEHKFEHRVRLRVRGGSEIISIASRGQENGFRLAVGTLDCNIVSFNYDGGDTTTGIFGISSFVVIPRAMSYQDNNNIRVLSLHNGFMYTVNGETGDVIGQPKPLADVIGSATIDEGKGHALISSVDGFSLHQLSSGATIATYEIEDSLTSLPRPVIFGEGRRVVIVGSNHGRVYVFEKKGGQPIDVLQHDVCGTVQSIAAHWDGRTSTIVCATSSNGRPSMSIWVRVDHKARPGSTSHKSAISEATGAGTEHLLDSIRKVLWIVLIVFVVVTVWTGESAHRILLVGVQSMWRGSIRPRIVQFVVDNI
ncbi:WD40-repeat-containing domain protein [Earliella scabrosa]|nr:WD40-repeat-containing domain protein [Earliella scabrosa]